MPCAVPDDHLRPALETGPTTLSPDARVLALTGQIPAARTSFVYPKEGVRIVTPYGYDPKGREFQVARIVYPRRK